MVKLAVLLVALAACQSHGDQPAAHTRDDARATTTMPPAIDASEEPVREPEPPDPGKVLADLGAVSAWQAVIDRAHYLARRGQHGVVYGTLGAPVESYVWLVDDTDGNGSLAIRVVLGTFASKVKQGERVALGGAWQLDENRRWYWKVDRLTPLLPAPPSDLKEPPSAPGHEIQLGALPPGAVPVSQATDNDVVTFQVTGPRQLVMPGEGWPVADKLGQPVFALLNLPGEWPSYGGQDFRTADERWQLERGKTYWVRIGKIRRPSAERPALINARTPPIRIK